LAEPKTATRSHAATWPRRGLLGARAHHLAAGLELLHDLSHYGPDYIV
jgi:hypothetical protein